MSRIAHICLQDGVKLTPEVADAVNALLAAGATAAVVTPERQVGLGGVPLILRDTVAPDMIVAVDGDRKVL